MGSSSKLLAQCLINQTNATIAAIGTMEAKQILTSAQLGRHIEKIGAAKAQYFRSLTLNVQFVALGANQMAAVGAINGANPIATALYQRTLANATEPIAQVDGAIRFGQIENDMGLALSS